MTIASRVTAAAPGAVTVALDDPALVARRALTIARRTALGILADRDAAADVAQEVAIEAVRRASGIRDADALDAWLHRVAVRTALREARRGRRRLEAEHAHHAAAAGSTADEPLSELLSLLAELPPRQRAALTLRYVHDLPDAAIARALRCRPGTVRALLSRGRDALRDSTDFDRRSQS